MLWKRENPGWWVRRVRENHNGDFPAEKASSTVYIMQLVESDVGW